ncbi:hypothetical protein [Agromyces sp. NPDC058064]|uniref:hypothetical protein n=1 Tax=Agromyces sp. NPDC058064 TaxID=3346322 RepID=UPI0036D952E3
MPPGFGLFRLARVSTCVRLLRTDAPVEVQARYYAYVLANLVGRCAHCDAVAVLHYEPEQHPTSWAEVPITLHVPHDPACPAVFVASDAQWLVEPDEATVIEWMESRS